MPFRIIGCMKNCILFFFVVITFINPLKSQTLGTDINGNSPLVHQGGNVYADLINANFGASFLAMTNNTYYRRSTVLGMKINGADRAGTASFLSNGITAPQASAAFTVGISTSNNFINHYKPRTEYWALLDEEDQRLTSRMNYLVKDSFLINNILKDISKKYPAETDTLKKLFFSITPTFGNLKLVWRAYAKTVSNGTFYYDVEQVLEIDYAIKELFTEYQELKKKHNQIILQKQNIDKPLQPFVQNTLYFTLGANYSGIHQIDSPKNKATVIYNETTDALFAVGGSHCFGNRFFIGYQLGQAMFDNFETLSPLSYDTSQTSASPQAVASRKQMVYTDSLVRKVSPYFSLQVTFQQRVGKIGRAIITPLQFTYSVKASLGASVQLITNNGVSVGVAVENRFITTKELEQSNQDSFNKIYFGFRLGLMLADFDFMN